jgi:hypothetical protein
MSTLITPRISPILQTAASSRPSSVPHILRFSSSSNSNSSFDCSTPVQTNISAQSQTINDVAQPIINPDLHMSYTPPNQTVDDHSHQLHLTRLRASLEAQRIRQREIWGVALDESPEEETILIHFPEPENFDLVEFYEEDTFNALTERSLSPFDTEISVFSEDSTAENEFFTPDRSPSLSN